MNAVAIAMIMLGIRSGELEPFNYFAFANVIIGRACVISGKYGYFRGNHLKIFNSIKMTS
jgi:hypothetical protein